MIANQKMIELLISSSTSGKPTRQRGPKRAANRTARSRSPSSARAPTQGVVAGRPACPLTPMYRVPLSDSESSSRSDKASRQRGPKRAANLTARSRNPSSAPRPAYQPPPADPRRADSRQVKDVWLIAGGQVLKKEIYSLDAQCIFQNSIEKICTVIVFREVCLQLGGFETQF